MKQLIVTYYIYKLNKLSNETKMPIKPTDFVRGCMFKKLAGLAFVEWQAQKSAMLKAMG